MKILSVVAVLVLVCCGVREVDSCTTSGDCAASECCVSRFHPIGKRQLLLQPADAGTCQPLSAAGQGCLVSQGTYDASTHANRMYYSCPCVEGLTCQGSGLYEVPLGEHGTCV